VLGLSVIVLMCR